MGEGEGKGVRAIRRGFAAYSDAVSGCLARSWGEFSESASPNRAPISRMRIRARAQPLAVDGIHSTRWK